jgi:hypothetical protein
LATTTGKQRGLPVAGFQGLIMTRQARSLTLILVVSLSLSPVSLGRTRAVTQAPRSFYVFGAAVAPGEYDWREGLTLRQAISLAQGITAKAAATQTVIFRKLPNGKREEIQVDLSAVMNGKVADLSIEADDFIIIPKKRSIPN